MMIRWISSEVRIFAFLKNYMLVSCFLGFGLGCFLCRKRINLIAMAGCALYFDCTVFASAGMPETGFGANRHRSVD